MDTHICNEVAQVSCGVTVLPPLLLCALVIVRLLSWLCTRGGRPVARPPRATPLFALLVALVGGGSCAAALLVEPWLDDADRVATWPPPDAGVVAATLWGCYAVSTLWVARVERQSGRRPLAAHSLVLALALRASTLVVGLSAYTSARTNVSFLIAEPLLVAGALVAAAVAVSACAPPPSHALVDGLQPLRLGSMTAEQLRLQINDAHGSSTAGANMNPTAETLSLCPTLTVTQARRRPARRKRRTRRRQSAWCRASCVA